MAQSGRFEGDQRPTVAAAPVPVPTNSTSFSQLLFGDDDHHHHVLALDLGHSFSYHHDNKPPKMLCFGGDQTDADDLLFGNTGMASAPPQRSVITCTDSCSSVSSVNNNNGALNALPKSSNKKRNGSPELATTGTVRGPTEAASSQGIRKKSKPEARGHVKVRKERLGERIAALQQLVSPFGKTDTASVLHEAMGYIRFLQDQVQVLCSPYLQPLPAATEGGGNGAEAEARTRGDLRSRGLCLVPLACTVHVAGTNGADFWSPAMGNYAGK